eukprot:scaffold3227_cov239-Pinguiococcus_pyrenoidosus.AAC.2
MPQASRFDEFQVRASAGATFTDSGDTCLSISSAVGESFELDTSQVNTSSTVQVWMGYADEEGYVSISYAEPFTVVAAAGGAPSVAPTFQNGHAFCTDFTFEKTLTMCWTLNDARLEVELQYPEEGVWLGWAVAVRGHSMAGADAVIGSSRGVERYLLRDRDIEEPLDTSVVGLQDDVYESANGVTSLSFSRLVDANGDARDLSVSDVETIIVAMGRDLAGDLEEHLRRNSGHVHVTFAGGVIPPTPSPTAAPVTFAPSALLGVFDFCTDFTLERPLRFCWRLSAFRLEVQVEYPQENVWLGWAIAVEGHDMTNADAVIGSSRGVERYLLSDGAIGEPLDTGDVGLADEWYSSSDGWSRMYFSRLLDAANDARDVSLTSFETIIVAVGAVVDQELREHHRHQKGHVDVDFTTGVVGPPTPAPVVVPIGTYDFCVLVSLSQSVQMCWSVSDTMLHMRLEWCGADAWIGWALAVNDYEMTDADAVIGSSRGVERYVMRRTEPGSPMDEQVIGLSDEMYESQGGSSVLTFSRLLDASDGGIDISLSGSQSILLAVGDVDDGRLREHGPRDRISAEVNFYTGDVKVRREDPYVVAHGALLSIAWYVYAPLSAILAVVKHSNAFPDMAGDLHHLHVGASIAVGVNTVAGVVVLMASSESVLDNESDEENDGYTHAVLGLFVTALVGLQILMGFFRPPAEKGSRPGLRRTMFNWTHRVAGHAVLALGQVEVLLGIQLVSDRGYRYADDIQIALIVLLVTSWVVMLGGRAVLLHHRPRDPEETKMISEVAHFPKEDFKDADGA